MQENPAQLKDPLPYDCFPLLRLTGIKHLLRAVTVVVFPHSYHYYQGFLYLLTQLSFICCTVYLLSDRAKYFPQAALIKELLQLIKSCLAYDFIGTSFDESTDDMGTVHIPTQWKQRK